MLLGPKILDFLGRKTWKLRFIEREIRVVSGIHAANRFVLDDLKDNPLVRGTDV
jgi:hypothetical protein